MSTLTDENPFLPADAARWLPTENRTSAVTTKPEPRQDGEKRRSRASHISEARERIIAELKLRAEYGDAAIGGEELGFSELDSELIVEGGRLMVVGAREGVGKTAWALQVARYIATRLNPLTGRGGKVVYYITEMSVQQTVERIVVAFAQLQMRNLKKGVTLETVAAVETAFDLLEASGLYIVNAAGWDIDEIVADAHALREEHPDLRAVFVDNLTGVDPAREFRNRAQWEQWGDIVKKLNTLSMTDKGVGTPVVLLAHLKRGDRLAAHKEPTAQDFAGSDAINRWASILVLIHERTEEERQAAKSATQVSAGGFGGGGWAATNVVRPDSDELWTSSDGKDTWMRSEIGAPDADASHTFIVTKNRDGRRFRADLHFIGSQMRFTDPKGHSLRPYEMPDPEPVARTEFRKAMLALGDL